MAAVCPGSAAPKGKITHPTSCHSLLGNLVFQGFILFKYIQKSSWQMFLSKSWGLCGRKVGQHPARCHLPGLVCSRSRCVSCVSPSLVYRCSCARARALFRGSLGGNAATVRVDAVCSAGGLCPSGTTLTVDTCHRCWLCSGVAQVCHSACSCNAGNSFWELAPGSWLHPSYLVKLGVDKVSTVSSVHLWFQLMLQSQWKLVQYG